MDRPREKSAPKMVTLYVNLEEVCNGTIRQVSVKKNIICRQHSLAVCIQCNGRIIVEIEETFAVEIKPGMLEGTEIFRFGAGDEELDKSAGDLIFIVKYLENDDFQYKPIRNLVTTATIPLHQAIGCNPIEIKVKTPNIGSDLHLTKKCTKGQIIRNGQKMCIPNEGVPDYFDPGDTTKRGKLIVELNVEWPRKLSTKQVKKITTLFGMASPVDPNDIQMVNLLKRLSPEEEHLHLDEFFPDSYWFEPKIKTCLLKKIQTVLKWFVWSKNLPPKILTITRSTRSILDVSDATSSTLITNAEEDCHLNRVTNPKVLDEETSSIPTSNADPNEHRHCHLNKLNPGILKSNFWENSEHYYLNRTDDDKCECPTSRTFNPKLRTSEL